MTGISTRSGGRSVPVALLVSLTALAVAATWLLGGGARSDAATTLAGPDASRPAGAEPWTPEIRAVPRPTVPAGSESRERPLLTAARATGVPRPTGPEPAAPRRLIVPRLDVDLPVVPTGVSGDGQMALPERPSEIGWYRYGARPGERGSAVLAGHVDSDRYGIGPLAGLRDLRKGDKLVVQRAGADLSYEVRRVQLISKRAVPLAEIFDRDGPATLRIVTCGGPYVRSRGGYLDNLVVTAVPR